MQAKKLVQVAADCGADAIKFQTYRAKTVYAQNAGSSDYLSKHGINKNINDIFERLEMPYEMIPKLHQYCEKQGIQFMSTPFSVQDAKQIDPYVKVHKVASYEINHVRLLEFLAQTNKPIIVSTGASTYDEIDFTVDLLKKKSNKTVALLQCTAKYPAELDTLNLLVIPQLKAKYDLPVGLSDHSIDPLVGPLLAVGLGATIIEKHFTLDRNLPGPDHPFALVPAELKTMIQAIRMADSAKGTGKKQVLAVETELRKFATRSIQAIKDIKKGETLLEGYNIEVLRPGNRIRGLDARFLSSVNGKKAKNDIKTGDGVTEFAD
ncbi:MAG: N-acetylneuraminate synthase family protein [Candidatus Nitrosotenuis sp.]